jgi:hypothetical protein
MPGGISYIGDLTIVESGGEITSQSIGDKALMSTAADATSIEVSSSTGKLGIVSAGSSLANGVQRAQVSKFAGYWIQGTLTAATGNAGALSIQNTYGSNLIVTRALVYLTALVGSAATLNVGVGSASDDDYDNLIDGLNVNSATGSYDNLEDHGSSGKATMLWPTTQYITATLAAGEGAGSFAGKYAIHVIDINS